MCGLKPKRKNSEKRKAKSRDAARVRRSKESDIFRELTELLPLSEKIRATLDKTVVTRLAVCYIRLQELIKSELTRKRGGKELDKKLDALYLKAFNGFMVIVGADGFVSYLSENVSLFLGLTQIDVMAQSIYEFTHASNHEQLREMLLSGSDSEETKTCCLLFKCTLTSKGHNVSVKLAGHKVMDCSCIRLAHSNSIMMLCRPLLDPVNIDQPLGSHVFVTKHSLDMKFVYTDKKMQELLGYDDLTGQSVYTYAYGTDCALLRKAYSNMTKGQTVTELYRMLTARGGYLWLQTQATVVVDPWTQKPECVVCINSAVGGIEQSEIVLGEVQMASMYTPPLTPEEFVLETDDIFDPTVEPLLVGEDDLNDVLFPEINAPLANKNNAIAANNVPPLFGAQATTENPDQELDVSLFAPFIPMDSADDTLFPQMDDLDILNFVQMPENAMLGKTESVFGQMPDEVLERDRKSTRKNLMPLGDAEPQNIGPHRIKQTVETNCASPRLPSVTFRPSAAGARMAGATSVGHDHGHIALPADSLNFGGVGFVRRPEVRFGSSSANGGSAVLRNLLLKGADIPSGYSIRNTVASNHQQGSADRVGVLRYGSNQWSGARVG